MKQIHRERGLLAGSAFPLIIFFLSFLLPGFSLHAEGSPYLSLLLKQAQKEKLWNDPYWHTLLHYKRTLFGFESLVDDPSFFQAPSGKHDPQAELEETIRGFFLRDNDEKKKPAICRFVARYHWLREKLNIDPSRLPVSECRKFKAMIDQIRPASATLIFPTAHINSPASMFGHTLLTIDTTSGSRLLAYAINYSAVTRETFGPLFAFKGLFGLYPGYFSMQPYYTKLQEYSDIDNRDIWEYPLNLTVEEINRLLMHAFEMDLIYSDYYFFDENCSYNLFFLLDAARPSLHLADSMPLWVIPLDTIRKVRAKGLTTDAIYRPSRASRITYLAFRLTPENLKIAGEVSTGQKEPESILSSEKNQESKTVIIDLASEYLQYLHAKKKTVLPQFQERFRKILQARSSLGAVEEESNISAPSRPDEGHLSNRFRGGAGFRDGGGFFQEIGFRPAYHQLIDDDRGYIEGAQIVFGDTSLRYYSSDHKIVLQSLDIIDILSVSPWNAFFRPVSWKIKTGFYRETGNDGQDHLIYRINTGGGFSFKQTARHLLYLLGEADFLSGGGLDEHHAGGIGASAGLISRLHRRWKIHLFTQGIYYPLTDRHDSWETGLQQNITLGTNSSLRLDARLSRTHGYERTEAMISYNCYF